MSVVTEVAPPAGRLDAIASGLRPFTDGSGWMGGGLPRGNNAADGVAAREQDAAMVELTGRSAGRVEVRD